MGFVETSELAGQYCVYGVANGVAGVRGECIDVFGMPVPLHAARRSPAWLVDFTTLGGIWDNEQPATYTTVSAAATAALAIGTADIGAHNNAVR